MWNVVMAFRVSKVAYTDKQFLSCSLERWTWLHIFQVHRFRNSGKKSIGRHWHPLPPMYRSNLFVSALSPFVYPRLQMSDLFLISVGKTLLFIGKGLCFDGVWISHWSQGSCQPALTGWEGQSRCWAPVPWCQETTRLQSPSPSFLRLACHTSCLTLQPDTVTMYHSLSLWERSRCLPFL